WIEGDMVYTESKFPGGKRKVKNGQIIVQDTEGNELLTGLTDDKGEFSFKIPKKTSLKVILKAGMGHQGEWLIPEDEISSDGISKKKPAELTDSNYETRNIKKKILTAGLQEEVMSQTGTLDRDEIRMIIENALDIKLKPLIRKLNKPEEKKNNFKDVIGGIGYIFGLFGVAAYMASRRKKDDTDQS
ncbi:hypothetical protein QUF76_11995, partial [Desulfobacterales bacterium HSG16]|nr:hypothetical protein [Desulfobacterales bacterium HSG16]